jgi:hypothetical protein
MKTMIAVALLCALAGGAFAGDLPDRTKTPGDVDASLTAAKLCAKGFTTKSIRNVPSALKAKVYSSYHLKPGVKPCACEVDHLVSLEIGGSNSQKNLWPQSYVTAPWNAHVKDRLENQLHNLVCAGTITLDQAQTEIRADWISSYNNRCQNGSCPSWSPPK